MMIVKFESDRLRREFVKPRVSEFRDSSGRSVSRIEDIARRAPDESLSIRHTVRTPIEQEGGQRESLVG